MQPQLQGVEVESVRRGDHDLAVDARSPCGSRSSSASCSSGKVAIERPESRLWM